MRKLILVSALAAGVIAIFAGVAVGLALLAVGQPGGRSGVSSSALGGVFGFLALVLGAPLAWSSARALNGAPARPLRLPGWGWLGLSAAVAIVLGQGLLSRGLNWPVPFFHVAAAALPALLFLSLTAGAARRRGDRLSSRAAAGSVSWGGLGGIGIALLLELIVMVVGGIVLLAGLQITAPELSAQLQEWARSQMGGGAGDLPDLQLLSTLAGMPLVVLAALGFIGVIAPAIEEAAKTLALPLLALGGRRLTRLDGFVYGVAAGAGFAIAESTFYGLLGLGSRDAWSTTMLMRGSTAVMHCLASGLAGLGWQAILAERRWPRGLALGLAAAALHGAWNVAVLGQALIALQGLSEAGGAAQTAGLLVVVVLVGLLAILWLGAVISLPLIAFKLAGRVEPPAAPDGVEPAGAYDIEPGPAGASTEGEPVVAPPWVEPGAEPAAAPVSPLADQTPEVTDEAIYPEAEQAAEATMESAYPSSEEETSEPTEYPDTNRETD